MAFPSSVAGAPISGFTSPTYTFTKSASAPNSFSSSYAVTAIGGTQAGVDTGSSPSRPWTWTLQRPPTLKQLNAVDASGVVRNVQMNQYDITYRKGLTVLAGQAPKTAVWRLSMPIPAGADTADVPNIKGMVSAFFGTGYDLADELVSTFTTGELAV